MKPDTPAVALQHDLRAVARQFVIPGQFLHAAPYGSGHINDTYCVIFEQDGTRLRYIFQRINHLVFKNPAAVMENITRTTSHLQSKFDGLADASRRSLTLVPSRDGGSYYQDEHGNFWRVYLFIERARTYDAVESPAQAFAAAKAFADFQKALADLPPPALHHTIPDFHHAPKRFAALEQAIASDRLNRAALASEEIEVALRHKSLTRVLLDAGLPERVTHNDTKLNNVMLDDTTGEGICIIDLDTLMPGLVPYDFGDMVRTMTSTTKEDEPELSKVTMQFPLFEAVARGYLGSAAEFLTLTERRLLVAGGKLITFTIAIRFLSDFLAGDTYFKVHRPGHNLDRCRTQLRLLESIEAQEERMNKLVQEL